jgi:phosphoheptose isomerase
MTLSDRIEQLFQDQQHSQQRARESLSEVIVRAAELIFSRIIQGQKLLVCGNGGAAALAQLFTANMLYCFEEQRPGLPALALSADCATLTAIASGDSMDEVYARQIGALGQPGDLLLLISPRIEPINLMRAVQEAQEREMGIIALTGASDDGSASELARLLGPDDLAIPVLDPSDPRLLETQLFIIHCLCDLIDRQLLGH